MNNYIDYNYYANTFKGTLIPQEKFDVNAMKASSKIRNRIMNKDISSYETEVKNAACLVAEIIYNQELNKIHLNNVINGTENIITSEKVGDYSRTMSGVSITELEKLSSNEYTNKLIDQEIEETLFLTGLLYSGVEIV